MNGGDPEENGFAAGIVYALNQFTTIVLVAFVMLGGLKLLGQYNRKPLSKVSEGTRRARRSLFRKLSDTAAKLDDGKEIEDLAYEQLIWSYAKTWEKDISRGVDVLGEAFCKKGKLRNKLL